MLSIKDLSDCFYLRPGQLSWPHAHGHTPTFEKRGLVGQRLVKLGQQPLPHASPKIDDQSVAGS